MALRVERQSAWKSEIKNGTVGQTWMAKCNNFENWTLRG